MDAKTNEGVASNITGRFILETRRDGGFTWNIEGIPFALLQGLLDLVKHDLASRWREEQQKRVETKADETPSSKK